MKFSDIKLGMEVVERKTKKTYIVIGVGNGVGGQFIFLGDEYMNGFPGGWKNTKISVDLEEFNTKGT